MLKALPRCSYCAGSATGRMLPHSGGGAWRVGRFWAVLLLGLTLALPARTDPLPSPSGEVLLIVSGAIENTNAPGEARLDLAILETLPSHTIVTSTPWSDAKLTLTGPRASDVMKLVGASGTTATAVALNDYKAEIPLEDFAKYGVIIAVKMDGQYMRIRDKGPLWVVYPLDDYPEIQESAPPRMVWQLERLVVR